MRIFYMPTYPHTIRLPNHETFLEQGRSDPITGERLEVGDQVVFCAGCRSAFLLDSWNYMDKRHCGQRGTLKDFPAPRQLSLKPDDSEINLSFALERLLHSKGI
ncbi:MAG: hypothetical protein AAF740_07805, partial [Bacteroidota bacterium]